MQIQCGFKQKTLIAQPSAGTLNLELTGAADGVRKELNFKTEVGKPHDTKGRPRWDLHHLLRKVRSALESRRAIRTLEIQHQALFRIWNS